MKKLPAALAALTVLLSATVAAHATPILIVDGDNDGVSDENDDCPYTPPNTAVGPRGCPISADADGDGIPDAIDDCPYSPKGAQVDPQGCALDSDLDGVPDGMDRCPNSTYGERVDSQGCELRAAAVPVPAPVAAAPVAAPAGAPLAAVPSPRALAPAPVAASASAPASARPSEKPAVVVDPKPAAEPPMVIIKALPAVSPAFVPQAPPNTEPAASRHLLVVETLGTVRFGRGTSELSELEQQRLQRLVEELLPRLAGLPDSGLYVSANQRVGEASDLDLRRAQIVRSFLIAKGLPSSRVRLSDAPRAPRKDASGQTAVLQLLPLR